MSYEVLHSVTSTVSLPLLRAILLFFNDIRLPIGQYIRNSFESIQWILIQN